MKAYPMTFSTINLCYSISIASKVFIIFYFLILVTEVDLRP
jgi:hypothetical protein